MEEEGKVDRTLLSSNKDKFSFTVSHKKMLRCAEQARTLRRDGAALIVVPGFPLQFQDTEASDQLRRLWILAKPEGQQAQAGEGRVRVRVRRGGAEDRRIPHQEEKELGQEGSVL